MQMIPNNTIRSDLVFKKFFNSLSIYVQRNPS